MTISRTTLLVSEDMASALRTPLEALSCIPDFALALAGHGIVGDAPFSLQWV